MRKILFTFVIVALIAGCSATNNATPIAAKAAVSQQNESLSGAAIFQMEAWADNWFAAYSGEKLIVEDSIPITTERSFNAETITFAADYPLHLNFILKDFKENDTGLEYIGARNQQSNRSLPP